MNAENMLLPEVQTKKKAKIESKRQVIVVKKVI